MTLVAKNLDKDTQDYKINFNFIVIDKYNQIYNFPVREETMSAWAGGMEGVLSMVNYHIDNNRFDLPYDFLTKSISL